MYFSFLSSGGICLLLSIGASNYSAAAELGLDDAIRQATNQSAAIKAGDAAIRASRDASLSADQLPDPTLSVGLENLPVDGPNAYTVGGDFMTMRRIGIQQEWVSGEKRQLQRDVADRMVDREEAGHLMHIASVREKTAVAWLDALYAQRKLKVIEALAFEMAAEFAGAKASYRGGHNAATDVSRSNQMLALADDAVLQAKASVDIALTSLSRWEGSPVSGVRDDAMIFGSDVPTLSDAALRREHPGLAEDDAALQTAEAESALASKNRTPNWTWNVSYAQRGSQYSNMVAVGVSIPLTLHAEHVQDQTLATKLELANKERFTAEDDLRDVRTQIDTLNLSLTSGQTRLSSLRSALLPAAAETLKLAETQYAANQGTLADLFIAKRTQLDAELQVIELEHQVALIWAQLAFMVVPPDLQSPHAGASHE